MSELQFPVFDGESMTGIFKGSRTLTIQGRDGPYQKVFCGLLCDVAGAYGTKQELIELQIPKSMVEANVPQKLEKYVEMRISLPFWGSVWRSEKTAGLTRYLANDVLKVI